MKVLFFSTYLNVPALVFSELHLFFFFSFKGVKLTVPQKVSKKYYIVLTQSSVFI